MIYYIKSKKINNTLLEVYLIKNTKFEKNYDLSHFSIRHSYQI